MMNQYAVMAEQYWERFLPHRVQQLTNPPAFFESLGEQVAEEIGQLTRQLAGADPAGETDLQRVERLTAARNQAREHVLTERVLLSPDPGTPQDEDTPEEPTPG